MPIIAATLMAAVSYIPLSFTVAGLTIGAAEIFVALTLVYYISINVAFAVGNGSLSSEWQCSWPAWPSPGDSSSKAWTTRAS